jgi:hypothetical protein
VLALWQEYRSGGFGAGHLPFAGGAAEQPAILMDALHLLSGAAELLKPKKGNAHDQG